MSNPATILSFAALFAGLGLAAEPTLGAAASAVAGVFIGSLLWWAILSGGVAAMRHRVGGEARCWINRVAGRDADRLRNRTRDLAGALVSPRAESASCLPVWRDRRAMDEEITLMMMMRWKTLAAATLLSAGVVAAPLLLLVSALGQELKIGVSTEPSAMDPHYHNLGPNNQIAFTIFDTLILQDETQKLTPGLAESWKALNDTTWEFKLRKGVKFHDGSPFTAADVVFTMARPAKVPTSPSPFALFTRSFSEVKAIDDFTVQFHHQGAGAAAADRREPRRHHVVEGRQGRCRRRHDHRSAGQGREPDRHRSLQVRRVGARQPSWC